MKNAQSQRITIRLTPFQARQLWLLRNAGLTAGSRPRTATEVLIRALLDAGKAAQLDGPSRTAPSLSTDDEGRAQPRPSAHADQTAA